MVLDVYNSTTAFRYKEQSLVFCQGTLGSMGWEGGTCKGLILLTVVSKTKAITFGRKQFHPNNVAGLLYKITTNILQSQLWRQLQ